MTRFRAPTSSTVPKSHDKPWPATHPGSAQGNHRSIHIALERPDQAEVEDLIAALDSYQKPMYPPDSHHGLDIAALVQPNVLFAVARDAAAVAIACGAIVLGADYGEIKRMFVHPRHRGQGIAKALLAFLEERAIAIGCTRFKLETGVSQPEALGLYERAGYARCGPFGRYTNDPFSVFMHKQVAG